MHIENLFNSLRRFRRALPALVADVSVEDARWKPADGAWSILEIVRHLVDEEVEDFRTRVRLTLEDPSQPWPPIDPEAAAVERRYNEGDFDQAVTQFVNEREKSLEWLEPRLMSLAEHADQAWEHPKFGPITAGEVFCSWVAHDQLHTRQIAKRLFQLTQRDAGRFSVEYAGNW